MCWVLKTTQESKNYCYLLSIIKKRRALFINEIGIPTADIIQKGGWIMELLDPKNDFVFYWLFGRKEETRFIKDFLSALFDEEITEIEHLTPKRKKTFFKGDEMIRMDVNVLVRIPNKHTKVGILVVNKHMDGLCDKYYWAKVLTGQIMTGQIIEDHEELEELERIVTVNILNYVKFEQSCGFHSRLGLRHEGGSSLHHEGDSKASFTDKFEFHFLQLPKIELDIGKHKLLDWLIYFRYYNNREVMKDLLEANKMIRTAVHELTNPEVLELYEMARRWELDCNDGISVARGEGRQEGIQQGRQQGIQEGMLLIINNMLKKGYTLDEIREKTGLTEAQIKELQEKNRSNK